MKNSSPSFEDLGVAPDILAALKKKGYETPTPVQDAVIEKLLEPHGPDLMVQAKTGTGKTAAFAIPLLQRCNVKENSVQSLVLAPTRELAVQVRNEIQSMQTGRNLRILTLYGGQGMASQIKDLKQGAHIVVGTPGRVLDHVRAGRLKLNQISILVLDEADRMLDMGFQEELEAILEKANPIRQTLLFSATFTKAIRKTAEKYLKDSVTIEAKHSETNESKVEIFAYRTKPKDKPEALRRILSTIPDFYGLIFCARKADVDELARYLSRNGFSSEGLHGDMAQQAREIVLGRFRKKKVQILVATDVAARGIDVDNLGYVIHYDIPDSPDAMVHRTGRTGRAGNDGVSVCLIAPSQERRFSVIEKQTGLKHVFRELPSREEVLAARYESSKQTVAALLTKNTEPEYTGLAEEILKENSPVELVAALLREKFGNSLLASSMPDIKKVSPDSGSQKNRQKRNSGSSQKYQDRSSKKKSYGGSGRSKKSFRSKQKSSR